MPPPPPGPGGAGDGPAPAGSGANAPVAQPPAAVRGSGDADRGGRVGVRERAAGKDALRAVREVAAPMRSLAVELTPISDLSRDPILRSPWARHPEIEKRVSWWLEFWRTREKGPFQRSLMRMGRYEAFIAAELAARELPPSLRYLPIIESAYNPTALSPVGAGGLWQFMPETARWLGLEVNALVDERLDPYAATPMALDYLSRLNKQFGSWLLALAAYNAGPGRVERVIRRHGGGDPRDDALFWKILPKLPPETRDFIPKYVAAIRVAEDPERYGMGGFAPDPAQAFDVVAVQGAASLDVVAATAGVAEEDVRFLNPQLLRSLTPGGTKTSLRLPAGAGNGFAARFAAVPAADRVNFGEHRVASGETLYGIARKYRVSVAELGAANPHVEPRRMRPGALLVIPGAAPGVHIVSRGESLWLIASMYDVGVERLRAHNSLDEGALLHPGDELQIPLRTSR